MADTKKAIVVTADSLALAFSGDSILIDVMGIEKHIGLAPGVKLMLSLLPNEARQFGHALIHKAAEAEARLDKRH